MSEGPYPEPEKKDRPRPGVLDGVRREGDRGSVDRLIAIDFVRFDGNPVAKIRTEIATAFAWLKSRRAEPAGARSHSNTTGVTPR